MRSGQYKISGSGSKGMAVSDGAVVGQFRSNQMELPPADSPIPEFPHMNSLVVTMKKMSDSRPLNKSCENLSGPRSAVNRVEQRVKSFLQRGEARLRQGEDPMSSPAEDGWQYGHVVTLPRRPRLSLALSHSALNHLSTSDTASCLSGSSGYSSSSSSSYGSFKSSASSNCSTLPRKKNSSEGHPSPSASRSCTFVDNPMYDITPGTDPRTYSLTNSLKRRGSPSPRHDPLYDVSPASDPRNYNLKSHRRRSASVPRHEPIYDITPDLDLQHYNLNKSTDRRGSVPVREPLYDITPDSNPQNYPYINSSSRQNSPNLGNDPIYDSIPGNDPYSSYRRSPTHHENLYDIARPSRLLTPDSGTHGGLDSLEESALDSLDCSDHQTGMLDDDLIKEDQVAKECREYFEKRLKNSETLKKRWSMCSSDSGADSGDSEISPVSSSSSAGSSSSSAGPTSNASRASSTSNNTFGSLHSSSELQEKCCSSAKKTPLDHKMEFLRKEIACLMKQDNQLFKQLLTLHESISALKSNPPHLQRPPSPASLDSFTEEEEEEEEEDEEDEEDNNNNKDTQRQQRVEKEAHMEDNLSDVDEGLETDHSLTHSISPSSTLSSKSSRDSTLSSKSCRDSTLSSKSSKGSNFSQDSHYSSTVEHHRHHSTNTLLLTNNSSITNDGIKITSNNNNSDTSRRMIGNIHSTSPSVMNFASNKITRRYSITTNDDFNVNIAINNEDVSFFPNENPSLSNSTSCLSKSSCYLSKSDPETTNLNINKSLGGSLGSFSSTCGKRLVRTRVSIPPSARNRDRSARPESFRLSTDMASHTRVLLKARSFAGASLRESPIHTRKEGRHFARTSLREDQLSYNRDKRSFLRGGEAASKMLLLSKRFANTSIKSADDVYFDYSHDEVHYDSMPTKGMDYCSDFDHSSPQSLESTSIVIASSSTADEYFETEYKDASNEDDRSESLTTENYKENAFAYNEDVSQEMDISSPFHEDSSFKVQLDVLGSPINLKKKPKPAVNQPVRQFSLMAPDTYPSDNGQAYQKSQKLRARSFTGMMTPRTLPALPQSPPREVLNDNSTVKKSSSNFRITEGADLERKLCATTMTRRARVTRDGYTFRFSSDLGLGSSSKVTPKSKREVFV